jgi:hypothetical protein
VPFAEEYGVDESIDARVNKAYGKSENQRYGKLYREAFDVIVLIKNTPTMMTETLP